MRILGTHHCGKEKHEAFKHQGNLYDILCHRDYTEPVVSIYSKQIQSEYYGDNMYLSIEVGGPLINFLPYIAKTQLSLPRGKNN